MKALISRLNLDPYVLALASTVVLASLLPARGAFANVIETVTDFAIALLFFLHGAKLSREAVISGVKAWKLHLTTLAITFGLFPLIGIGLHALPW